jgi:hypothetical protein
MPKLPEADRQQREAARKAAEIARNQAYWQDKLALTKALVQDAARVWQDAFAKQQLGMRELWLVLGVFEYEERSHLAGKRESCKSRWFDGIAPRAKEGYPYKGVSGFTARTAGKASQFLKSSGNGYVYLTDLGFALVQYLRELYAELAPSLMPVNQYAPLEVQGLGSLPTPRWRYWKD